jgi:hypothetical protein
MIGTRFASSVELFTSISVECLEIVHLTSV